MFVTKGLWTGLLFFSLTAAATAQGLFPSAKLDRTNTEMASFAKRYTEVGAYQDLRFGLVEVKAPLTQDRMKALTFNRSTGWPGTMKAWAEQILVSGGNPGLGLRNLHLQGYTGRGVSIAIIDQNLGGEHPEFAGKIAHYVDLGCEQDPTRGSMHGPAVTSLLVGTHLGTAPGATVYYYAVPSWKADSEYYAKALNLVVEENTKLPSDQKIRAVSVSAAPSGAGSPFTKNGPLWDAAVKRASEAGILVLDCTSDRGFVGPGYYDPGHPEDLDQFTAGWLNHPLPPAKGKKRVYAPCEYRTVAEQYVDGEPSYQYTGLGGLSWAIPYVTGVAALVWQANPAITGEQMQELLLDTARHTPKGGAVIDAQGAIQAAQDRK